MIKRLLSFLDASPVNFLAVKNISEELEKKGFKRLNPQEPLGKVVAGDKFFVTKNDSSIYAFQIGKKTLADAGFHMICAHCDSPTFRIKPNAEMTCEGGIVKLNTEVYGGPIMSTWFDRPLTLAGRVNRKGRGCDASEDSPAPYPATSAADQQSRYPLQPTGERWREVEQAEGCAPYPRHHQQ